MKKCVCSRSLMGRPFWWSTLSDVLGENLSQKLKIWCEVISVSVIVIVTFVGTCVFLNGVTIEDVFADQCESVFDTCMTSDACAQAIQPNLAFCDFPNDVMQGPNKCWVNFLGFAQNTPAYFDFEALALCVQDVCRKFWLLFTLLKSKTKSQMGFPDVRHPLSLSLSLSFTPAPSRLHTCTESLSPSHFQSLSLSHSLTLPCTFSHCLSLTRALSHSLSHPLSFPLTRSRSFSLSLSLISFAFTVPLSLSLSSLIHSHSLSCSLPVSSFACVFQWMKISQRSFRPLQQQSHSQPQLLQVRVVSARQRECKIQNETQMSVGFRELESVRMVKKSTVRARDVLAKEEKLGSTDVVPDSAT